MSAYAHQMEREFSARSLSSRGGSEVGSHYVIESGFYMTSFAATIFIGALVTVGVLFITLLIALTVMLQTCENRSKGVIEIQKPNDDYNYCKIFALHAEFNNLGLEDFPSICRSLAIEHIKGGQYERELNSTMQLVEKYFDSFVPLDDGLDVVLMDIDDILPSNPQYDHPLMNRLNQYGCKYCFEEAKHLKEMIFLRLYTELQAKGWSFILLSRKPETLQNATIEHLISAGYRNWYSVIMRLNDDMEMDSREYILRRRMIMQKKGFRVSGVISSQMDVFTGPFSGQRIFKLPNPMCYFLDHHPMEILYAPK
ncbi:uncharacterized protein At2g39920 [Manihot esculenta]|uniref:Uncharacterized protein n=7 Tax=Manihot esculenta TaxID=3983 RepID=A0ACB7GZC0_MANES|nr:uncharacterized protein At2g39920 [Manihot esculenta]XP_021625309.1 uncharacterized protein At2g39920 [Manihot esculenta]XP_021625310.1 uncharacterized protein At2g39920 [Manihot esculenta]XP_021625311.1 uncharacterized protein At2g39920 [Manihot esculenta]XP_043816846.1 uncharacterized protein At2g39920 [Manihot esculenta]KAG8644962.1 hypothetical protein MANES_10G018300v8 [Manihot esculenta]KAG8644963.1 hypothetical protein MANES_10G018300v8 [Manihot esculenta]KAG8644964.1 hypothetical 